VLFGYLSTMVVNLCQKHSLVSNWMSELRSVDTQADRLRFRYNLERLGEVMAYEISKDLAWQTVGVQTQFGTHASKVLAEQPVIATILRAGLPMHTGMMNYFNKADTAFIAAYRKYHRDGSFEINLDYLSSPSLENRVLILCDTMVATGATMVKTIASLKQADSPVEIHIACAIASTIGIEYIKREMGSKVKIWCGDIDDEITAKGYIVPGLGDAGDLAFGSND